MRACMGGFCARRDKCPHYTAEGHEPAERLCLPGEDGVRLVDVSPVRRIRVDVIRGQELAEAV